MKLLVIVFSLFVNNVAEAAKILIYDYKFQRSHVQFTNTIADILVDEGHDVVMLSNAFDASLRDFGSTRVRRYYTEQSPEAAKIPFDRMGSNHWKSRGFVDWFRKMDMQKMAKAMNGQCMSMLRDEKLIDNLRKEKFDVALTVPYESCIFCKFLPFVLCFRKVSLADVLYKADITNYALIEMHSTILNPFRFSGVPEQYSTFPGRFASFSDMTFSNRLKNFLTDASMKAIPYVITNELSTKLEEVFEEVPDIQELYANVSMVFINRVPAIEFPTLTTHTTVDIGGLTIPKTNKSLDEYWSSILSLRPQTVLISFGTIALSSDMPEEYKKSLLQAIKSFPDITFVWKYEKPEHRISEGVENLIEATFTPQKEILQDPRLSLFITHCGWSSTLETMMAGVPVIAIPTSTDQHRNAQVLKRGGGGIVMNKKELESNEAVVRYIKEILVNDSYRNTALRVASVINNSPYSGRENFLRNLNFLIKFGPLPNMRIPSNKQSFIEYYMIDVFALVTVTLLLIVYSIFVVSRSILRVVLSIGLRKPKQE